MIRTYHDVTPAVLKVMEQTTDPRLREVMAALVRHLHGFIVETRLTEQEFRAATAILAEMGRLTTDSHQKFVLMAGSLGVSSLVYLLNNGDQGRLETSQNLLGPFWRMHAPRVENAGRSCVLKRPAMRCSSTQMSSIVKATLSPGLKSTSGTRHPSASMRIRIRVRLR